MIRITNELNEITLLVNALPVGADNLEQLSEKLYAIERKIAGFREFIDGLEAKKKREALAQLLIDNDFKAKDLRLLDGRAFTRNQDGKVEEINYNKNVISLDCRDREDETPF